MTAGFSPRAAARCRGVSPSSSRALGSAPAATRAVMASGFQPPNLAAWCRGVHPSSSRAFESAPAFRQRATSATLAVAQNRIVFHSPHETSAAKSGSAINHPAKHRQSPARKAARKGFVFIAINRNDSRTNDVDGQAPFPMGGAGDRGPTGPGRGGATAGARSRSVGAAARCASRARRRAGRTNPHGSGRPGRVHRSPVARRNQGRAGGCQGAGTASRARTVAEARSPWNQLRPTSTRAGNAQTSGSTLFTAVVVMRTLPRSDTPRIGKLFVPRRSLPRATSVAFATAIPLPYSRGGTDALPNYTQLA